MEFLQQSLCVVMLIKFGKAQYTTLFLLKWIKVFCIPTYYSVAKRCSEASLYSHISFEDLHDMYSNLRVFIW